MKRKQRKSRRRAKRPRKTSPRKHVPRLGNFKIPRGCRVTGFYEWIPDEM